MMLLLSWVLASLARWNERKVEASTFHFYLGELCEWLWSKGEIFQ
jgi:hypothetical protein